MHDHGVAAYAASSIRQDDLVVQYAYLVKRIGHHLMARLPDNVQLDDLVQAGMLGLLEAAGKFDGGRGASFETYAGIRIRGAMLDEVRRGDWAPRSVHRNARKVAEAVRHVEARMGKEAQDKDIAAAMDIPLDDYHRMLNDASGAKLFSFEALLDAEESSEPAGDEEVSSGFERQAFKRQLADAIGALPERERLVLALYYDEELNLKEIGAVIGVSESRVSQIMSQSTLRLRARLAEWLED
jgi:RNA polymerase sigma factor for flagellar operon FliA